MSWIALALISAGFAALVAIFGKIGIANLDTTLATTIRSIVMAVFLVLVSLSLGKFHHAAPISGRNWLFIVLAGIAGALSWLFYFWALKNGPADGVAALDRTSVIFVVLLAALFLGEMFTWKVGLGAVLIAGGAILLTVK